MAMDDYSWIKVKRFKFDPNKSWEENYKALESHHVEETTFLINKVKELENGRSISTEFNSVRTATISEALLQTAREEQAEDTQQDRLQEEK